MCALTVFVMSVLSGCVASATPTSTEVDKASPTAIATKTRPADGAPMVYVPGGAFVMGSSDAEIRDGLG